MAVGANPIFEPQYDPCQRDAHDLSGCQLTPGLEGLFVAEIASHFYHYIQLQKLQWTFNQFVYMPSTHAERKCGFDVSFGHFDNESKRRVRLMHKLIIDWCDTNWKWDSNKEVNYKTKVHRCADHISKLVTQARDSEGRIRPYLSFSVCYCLHEYRRMGQKGIPAFEDIRRSIFIDLSPLANILSAHFNSVHPDGQLHIEHQMLGSESNLQARWVYPHGDKMLKAIGWEAFQNEAGTFLAGHARHG